MNRDSRGPFERNNHEGTLTNLIEERKMMQLYEFFLKEHKGSIDEQRSSRSLTFKRFSLYTFFSSNLIPSQLLPFPNL